MGGWTWCCFRQEPGYKKVDDIEAEPAQYISARQESEYDVQSFQLQNAVSSLYKKVSEWSLPKKQLPEKQNLFTLNEDENDFLIDEYVQEQDLDPEFPGRDAEDFETPMPKHTVSSIYRKVSTTKKDNLPTVHETEHESLMDQYTPHAPSPSPCSSCDKPDPSPSPSSPPQKNSLDFEDVVDEIV